MSKALLNGAKTMGTLPVFMTAISTILGAILFLKFGYAVGHVGLVGTLMIILIGHLVTIPTAMAVAEIATNQKVEGGGAYYIISRSFGLNVGGAIGIALYLAQAISIAFYVIAFSEALSMMFFVDVPGGMKGVDMGSYYAVIDKFLINYTVMGMLGLLILTRGANVGVKALYFVVVILGVSLLFFFIGSTDYVGTGDVFKTIEKDYLLPTGQRGPDDFFTVFAIIFPAFTGIAAGLGLSGDLKDPKKSLPKGTIWATVAGIIVYIAVVFKLYYSASPEDLANEEELIMGKIAFLGAYLPIVAIGLACAAISSALGSIMIAPRTMQALGLDNVLPGNSLNKWLAFGRKRDNEPINATLITVAIAFVFVSLGDINVVAKIISMFFMVTYGAICMVSFFEHFAADPAYRPTFKSRWYISLIGGILCFYLMFKMDTVYAIVSILLMVAIYLWISVLDPEKSGLANLFKGVMFQISRAIQIFLQRKDREATDDKWRPFIICLSDDSFKRNSAFYMTSWISHKYGFGTYMHYVEGHVNKETRKKSNQVQRRLINLAAGIKSRVYLDTIINTSFDKALEQCVQFPGISGKGSNMILFEYGDAEKDQLKHFVNNFDALRASSLDLCVLRSTERSFGYQLNIHIWIKTTEFKNSNLMILLGYIILGHPDWKNAEIKIYSIYQQGDLAEKEERLHNLVRSGRLPISLNNIQLIQRDKEEDQKKVINEFSSPADLTIIGFDDEELQRDGVATFEGFDKLGNILFVNDHEEKVIEEF